MAQGFFIQVKSGSPSFTIPADARVHSTTPYYKSAREESELDYPYAIFEINIEGKKDEVWVIFNETSSDGFDNGWDVNKLFSFNNFPQLYIEEGQHKLSIDALPLLEEETRIINLSFAPSKSGEHFLSLKEIQHLPETDIILEDLKTGQFHDITENETYSFPAFPDDDPKRFLLHFNPSVTGLENPGETEINIYAQNKVVYINHAGLSRDAKIQITDIWGRTLVSQQLNPSSTNQIPVNLNNAYIIVRVTDKGQTIVKKVFIR